VSDKFMKHQNHNWPSPFPGQRLQKATKLLALVFWVHFML